MRRAIGIEVEVEPIPDLASVYGRILIDGIEVYGKDLGIWNSSNSKDPMEHAALELVSSFGMELAYYINTRETRE